MTSPVHLLRPSVAGKEDAVAVEAVSDAVSAQRQPVGRGVDRDDWLPDPAGLSLPCAQGTEIAARESRVPRVRT